VFITKTFTLRLKDNNTSSHCCFKYIVGTTTKILASGFLFNTLLIANIPIKVLPEPVTALTIPL